MSDENRCRKDLKLAIQQIIDDSAEEIFQVSKFLFENPETAYEERKACEWLSGFLKERGFKVETGVGGVETAFFAKPENGRNNSKPTLAFLAEYDALPKIGHGCGHNLIAAASVGATLALHKAWPDLPGSLVLIGTPAEEGGGGKARLAEAGVFEGVDVSLMFHPGHHNRLGEETLGRIKARIEFFGRTAHAAASPEEGLNALDAIIGAFNNINALRQQIAQDSRIHGVITSGGDAPNVIPDYTAGLFYIRSARRDYLKDLFQRFENCCRGAALATGCRAEITVMPPSLEPMKRNYTLERVWEGNLRSLGLEPYLDAEPQGSTDLGNLSQIMPVAQPFLAICSKDVPIHSTGFATATQDETGKAMLLNAAKLLAMTACDYLGSPEIQKMAAKEFDEN